MSPSTSHIDELQNSGRTATIAAGAPSEKLVITWLAERADATPDAIAVMSGSESLTYRELDQRANQLAHRLQSLGVGPEVITAICLERSVMAVVAALAVLKAGGAYLPLDPSYPSDRLAFILDDARPAVVITQSQFASKAGGRSPQVIDLDSVGLKIWGGSQGRPSANLTPSSLAYVIYTSGSTGQPKGVQVTHSGLSNLIAWHVDTFGVTAADRATQLSSLGFDAAVWEMWAHLSAGASLYFVPEVVGFHRNCSASGWLRTRSP